MTKNKPMIAIVCHRSQPKEAGETVPDEISPRYTTAIIKAGGLPVLIPIDFPLTELTRLRNQFDGLLLAGGGDVETSRYHGKVHESVSQPCLERDALEIALTRLAFDTDWPLLGICRGIQVMNVAMGGSLFSDIADQVPRTIRHNSPTGTPRDQIIHRVNLEPASHISQITSLQKISVNSFHHQAIAKIADCFTVSGHSEDGLIEAIESPQQAFAIGVQWHPECMQQYPEHMSLFHAFVNACESVC